MHSPLVPRHQSNLRPHKKIGDTTQQIINILENDEIKNNQEHIESILSQLDLVLDEASQKAKYDYSDYQARLGRGNDTLEAVLPQNEIRKKLYYELMEALNFSPSLKTHLLHELFFDGLLRLGPKPSSPSSPVGYYFYGLENIKDLPNNLIIKDLPNNAKPEKYASVFRSLQKAPHIERLDLRYCSLGRLDAKILFNIFSYLGTIRNISLHDNKLWMLEKESLEMIFSHLGSLQTLNLSYNTLGKLEKEKILSMFSRLRFLKSIHLGSNSLYSLDSECLDCMFSQLENVKNIYLTYTDLGEMGVDQLTSIFSHLGGIKTIDLGVNGFGKFDDERLKCIFSHLQGAEKIYLDKDFRFFLHLKHLFPSLEWKLIER